MLTLHSTDPWRQPETRPTQTGSKNSKNREKYFSEVLTCRHEKVHTDDINCGTADFFNVLGLWVSVRRDGGVA
jgi:hypothetical protein